MIVKELVVFIDLMEWVVEELICVIIYWWDIFFYIVVFVGLGNNGGDVFVVVCMLFK